MIKRNLVSLVALGAFAFLAAGSTPEIMEKVQSEVNKQTGGGGTVDAPDEGGGSSSSGGSGGGNQAACKAWVEHHNSLSCMKIAPLDAATTCPPELDITPKDMSGYYKCMQDGEKCNGDIPDMSGASSCSPL